MKVVHRLNWHWRTTKSNCGAWQPERWVLDDRNSTNYCKTGLKEKKLRVTCKRCLRMKK